MVAEGSSIFRTALIITEKPDEVIREIMYTMERGVTILSGKGDTPERIDQCSTV